jgi:HK97 family phage prohead protease
LWHSASYLFGMDFKSQQPEAKAVTVFPDGTQQANFSYDFALDSKAVQADVDENGDLWISGYASDFGVDRQDEAFEPGAFERGLKAFLARNPIMLYHHQYDKALGQFVDARVDENGLWVKGRVDAPAPGSWAEDVFNKIRKGTIKSFSVGGLFRRRMTPQGPRIYDCDLGEISVTPFPVNPRTTFAVVASKAFENVKAPVAEAPPAEIVETPEVTETEAVVIETPSPETPVTEVKPEETPEAEAKPEETPEATTDIPDGAITAEKIAAGSITTEHLADDLRTRFSEFAPEAPSVEDAHKRLAEVTEKLDRVLNHVGLRYEVEATPEV